MLQGAAPLSNYSGAADAPAYSACSAAGVLAGRPLGGGGKERDEGAAGATVLGDEAGELQDAKRERERQLARERKRRSRHRLRQGWRGGGEGGDGAEGDGDWSDGHLSDASKGEGGGDGGALFYYDSSFVLLIRAPPSIISHI